MNKDELGYTLVELLVVVTIMAVVATAIATTFSVMTTVSTGTTEQYMVMSQVQVAGNTIVRDVASSCDVVAGTEGNWHCSMDRYTWNGADNLTTVPVEYVITDGVLKRSVNGADWTKIAEYISIPGSEFVAATENNTYILTLTAKFNQASFSSIYKVVCKSP